MRIFIAPLKDTAEAIKRFKAGKEKLQKGLEGALNKFGNDIVRRSKIKYLSRRSATTLGVVTGRLRSSVNFQPVRGNLAIEFGTDVPYGRAHELGFSGSVRVPAHSRLGFQVRAHSRKMNLRARPFLKTAIKDESPKFLSNVDKLVKSIYG